MVEVVAEEVVDLLNELAGTEGQLAWRRANAQAFEELVRCAATEAAAVEAEAAAAAAAVEAAEKDAQAADALADALANIRADACANAGNPRHCRAHRR